MIACLHVSKHHHLMCVIEIYFYNSVAKVFTIMQVKLAVEVIQSLASVYISKCKLRVINTKLPSNFHP